MNYEQYELSVLVPARNEEFLSLTVENILKNIRGKTEIIIVLDGAWANPGIPDDANVSVIYHSKSIGQRGAQNEACRISKAKYVMKIDAHCVVDEGFDIKLMKAMEGHDDWTVVPIMYNLHVFDWVCEEGHKIYQGPTPAKCLQCGKPMKKQMVWEPRWSRESEFYRFDRDLHFQYWGGFKHRPEGQGDIAPTLSLQGSCFMLARKRYWDIDICDEAHGSWGQQGTEVALKTWMSGGKVMVVKSTWYSHLFRTQGGDFGFPYPLSGSAIDHARKYSKELFIEGKYKHAIHDLSWVLEQFRPVPDWHTDESRKKRLEKGIVYYTNNIGNADILNAVVKQIKKGMKEKHITSVSLLPIKFGNNVVLRDKKSGYLTMAEEILAGLENSTADIVFFTEHDVLYHPSHFDFMPYREDVIYYNTNVWRVRASDGHALYCNNLKQLSGLCAYREVLIKHYRRRVQLMKEFLILHTQEDLNKYVREMGFEPGSHHREAKVDNLNADIYQSKFPNIDIRHESNLTPSRWNKEQFRNEKFTDGWTESNVKDLSGWKLNPGMPLISISSI